MSLPTKVITNNMLCMIGGVRSYIVKPDDIGKIFINNVDSGDGSYDLILPEIPTNNVTFGPGWGGTVVFSNYQQNNVRFRDQGRIFTPEETGDTTREGRSTVTFRHQSWGEWDVEGKCTTDR